LSWTWVVRYRRYDILVPFIEGFFLKPTTDCSDNTFVDQLIADYHSNKYQFGAFGHYYVVVPNHSYANWLKAQIVERIGICSGIKFEPLNAFLNRILKRLIHSEEGLIEADILSPALYSLLKELKPQTEDGVGALKPLFQWMQKQDSEQSLAALVTSLTKLFETYQIYRPDWLDAWSQGKQPDEFDNSDSGCLHAETESWQAELWRRLLCELPENGVVHRGALVSECESAFSEGGVERINLSGIFQLTVIGVSEIDPSSQALLNLLSGKMDVLRLDQQVSTHQDSNYRDSNAYSVIQPLIKNEQVHCVSHFSKMREVEGLHDFLLDQFNQSPDMNPHDIIVMSPDINEYTPYIQSVFENALSDSKSKIPYELTGTKSQANPLIELLIQLIKLPSTRYSLSDVIDILGSKFVTRRFGLTQECVEQVHAWLQHANVHWGLDERTLSQLNLPVYDRYTFKSAIDRLVLGLAVDGEYIELGGPAFENELPELLYGVEGISALNADLLGKLVRFIDGLTLWRDFCVDDKGHDVEHTGQEWKEALSELSEVFTESETKEQGMVSEWHRLLTQFDQLKGIYSFSYIVSRLDQAFEGLAKRQGGFRYGRVNFGAFGDLKGIPAKVIALLGLNESDFPRKPETNPINLALNFPREGDRDLIAQDEDAFFTAMSSASEAFYCSYVGRDIRTNTKRIPSLFLTQLLENSGGQLSVIQHPMKPYNEKYFKGEDQLFTYLNPDETGKARFSDIESLKETGSYQLSNWKMPEQITVKQLKDFLEDPAKVFYKTHFGFELPSLDEEYSDEEPFESNPLVKWKIRDALIREGIQNNGLSNEVIEHIADEARASGELEHDTHALNLIEDMAETASKVLDNVFSVKGNRKPATKPFELDVELDDSKSITLVGDLDIFSADSKDSVLIQPVHKEGSEVSPKYLMRAIVDTRVAEALAHEKQLDYSSSFIACKDKAYQFLGDSSSGHAGLRGWLQLYERVMSKPIAMNLDIAKEVKKNGEIDSLDQYRGIFNEALASKNDSYGGFRVSESFNALSHDAEAIDLGLECFDEFVFPSISKKSTFWKGAVSGGKK